MNVEGTIGVAKAKKKKGKTSGAFRRSQKREREGKITKSPKESRYRKITGPIVPSATKYANPKKGQNGLSNA